MSEPSVRDALREWSLRTRVLLGTLRRLDHAAGAASAVLNNLAVSFRRDMRAARAGECARERAARGLRLHAQRSRWPRHKRMARRGRR